MAGAAAARQVQGMDKSRTNSSWPTSVGDRLQQGQRAPLTTAPQTTVPRAPVSLSTDTGVTCRLPLPELSQKTGCSCSRILGGRDPAPVSRTSSRESPPEVGDSAPGVTIRVAAGEELRFATASLPMHCAGDRALPSGDRSRSAPALASVTSTSADSSGSSARRERPTSAARRSTGESLLLAETPSGMTMSRVGEMSTQPCTGGGRGWQRGKQE